MLLPALSRGKHQAIKIKCIANFRQIGFGLKMYIEDNRDNFPIAWTHQANPSANPDYYHAGTLGGGDPSTAYRNIALPATNRVLFKYVQAAKAFQCPADSGIDVDVPGQMRPTVYQAIGCSYRFNWLLQSGYGTANVADDPQWNLAGKKESYPHDPSRFIMMHEFAAYPFNEGGNVRVTKWHYASQPGKMLTVSSLKLARDKLVAPVLFVDGHVQFCDFTPNILKNPTLGLEPGKDWSWYKPRQL